MTGIFNRRVLVGMLFTALSLTGYISYKQLAMELLPNTELPFLIVAVSSRQEVDPKYMESQAVRTLEGAIGSLENIETIESYSERRQGTIMIYYEQDTDIKYAYLKLQQKVDAIRSNLDENFIVQVINIDTDQMSNQFMELQIRGGGGTNRVRYITDQKIVNELLNIDGIANASVTGGREKSVEVILNDAACEALNITPSQIYQRIAMNNQSKYFVGIAHGQNKKYALNVIAEFADISDLEDVVVREQGPVLLKHVAEINVGVKDETSISRVNGKEAITMQLIRDAQVNLIELSHKTHDIINQLNDKLKSDDIEIVVEYDQAEQIESNIDLIIELALVGGLLAVFVLWIFLRNLRLVVIMMLAIPISVLTAFNFFYMGDISLNSLTLVGMALAIGMLLDSSVVVLENIYRLYSQKKEAAYAVTQGTKEVWRSIFAATLTTIAVFIPFLFTDNFFIKIFGHHIGYSIITTLFVSLVVAFLLIPTATYFLLSRRKGAERADFQIVSQRNRLLQVYTLLLKSSLRHPLPVILGGVTLFFVSLFISLAQSLSVARETETPDINFYVTMPSGATLEKTATVVSEIESRLEPVEEKQDIISKIYEEEAVITIKLQEAYQEINDRNVVQIKEDIRQKTRDIPDADVSFEQPASSRRFRGGTGANFSQQFERMLGIGSQTEKVVIKGHDFDFMRNVAEQIEDALESSSSIGSAWMSIPGERPEMHLLFDVATLGHYDISLANIAGELSSFQDNFSSGITFKQGTEEIDIVIRGEQEEEEEKDIYDLQQLEIPGGSGSLHPLSQISNMVYSAGLASITRTNQERQIEVSYQFLTEINNVKSMLESARTEVDQIVAGFEVPTGIFIEVVHEDASFDVYYFLIAAGLILIYLILASVFESLFMPFVILFTVPLAAIGALWALIFTNTSIMNMNVLTGMLILLGIVVNNGIILLDYTNILRKRGFSRPRALIVAGQARVRPILITAITTIIAMLPLAMGRAEYVIQIGAPFAITVIGGLALSTLFTLVFIPTVYSGMESAIEWFKKLNLQIQLLQLAVFIIGCFLIFDYVDSVIWQILFISTLILAVPGVAYFILNSLRQARAEYIRPEEKISISVTNVSKIYDRPGRFIREWKKPERMQNGKIGHEKVSSLIWQVPLFVFLIYFVYGYLKSDFWLFILCHMVYFYILYLWNYIYRLFQVPKKLFKIDLNGLLFWGVPAGNLVYFLLHGWGIAGLIIIALLWYLALLVYTTSNRLHHHKVNINRLSGRFAGLRRRFYRFVQMIPVIGKKKIPFPALAGVSLEIGTGMFGLLGPNGAGKTTLMRIICGVLDQNYGKIRINGIDTTEKREELQGLIGYLPQEFGMYENMTAYEFLDYQAVLKNIMDKSEREEKIESVLKSVHMDEHKHETIGSFSGGMKQRIGIAQTLLHLPRILVVDEPTAGLDPRERIRFRNLLVELSRDRIVLFSTHVIEDISSSCREVAVLNRGKLCFMGTPIGMTKYASGYVWQFHIPLAQFEQVRKEFLVVHHMREGAQIRIRCLSKKQPAPDAQTVNPTLEDAYLWLLREVA